MSTTKGWRIRKNKIILKLKQALDADLISFHEYQLARLDIKTMIKDGSYRKKVEYSEDAENLVDAFRWDKSAAKKMFWEQIDQVIGDINEEG